MQAVNFIFFFININYSVVFFGLFFFRTSRKLCFFFEHHVSYDSLRDDHVSYDSLRDVRKKTNPLKIKQFSTCRFNRKQTIGAFFIFCFVLGSYFS
jgi:hypothetical protein